MAAYSESSAAEHRQQRVALCNSSSQASARQRRQVKLKKGLMDEDERPQGSQSDSSECSTSGSCAKNESHLDALPNELLLQIFAQLPILMLMSEEDNEWYVRKASFRKRGKSTAPRPGLRSYPFLAQVSRKWRDLLSDSTVQSQLWQSVVVNCGHELITSLHRPLKWSNKRPMYHEYDEAYANTMLSSAKIVSFIRDHASHTKSLTICNTYSFMNDGGETQALATKHDFTGSCLGVAIGLSCNMLTELRLHNCSDVFQHDTGVWAALTLCSNLKTLVVEGVRTKVTEQSLWGLSGLRKLEQLTLVGDEADHVVGLSELGLEAIPSSWSLLTNLQTLELRGHHALDEIPISLATLPSLTKLDVSSNPLLIINSLAAFTNLKQLALQNLHLSSWPLESDPDDKRQPEGSTQWLIDLTPLAPNLTALSLAGNCFTDMPHEIAVLKNLEHLDLSDNPQLQIAEPLTCFQFMYRLNFLNFKGIHRLKDILWDDAKCATFNHINKASMQLKRRFVVRGGRYQYKILMDLHT